MERFGLVGLPNAGKSSLFNALTSGGAHAAPHPFSTTAPNAGVAKVPDRRLAQLAAMSRSRRAVRATVHFTDIGGLVEGASRGDGLGNAFLGEIRNSDAIVYVLRAFDSPEVPGGDSEPLEQLRLLETELVLADLESAERQLDKLRRVAKGDSSQRPAVDLLARAVSLLETGTPLYRAGLSASDRAGVGRFFLLTEKPVLAVVNIGEEQIPQAGAMAAPVAEELDGAEVMALCVQLEAEAAQLDEGERSEMLNAFGLGRTALARLVAAARRLLGLRTFLTTTRAESRAWTFRGGATAAECAGLVHSDFERGFIRAEVIPAGELAAAGSWSAARRRGLVRSEGRGYPMADGDAVMFKFNV